MALMSASSAQFDEFVLAYESALDHEGRVDFARFLPEPEHPLFVEVLQELIRLDLEQHWRQGRRKWVEDYQRDYPAAFENQETLRAIAFEEYRVRRQAGETPSTEEYQRRFGVSTTDWLEGGSAPPARTGTAATLVVPPAARINEVVNAAYAEVFRELSQSNPLAADRLGQALTSMPRVGMRFLEFELVAELGRGAFATVFLAVQKELAGRPVALKISPDVGAEAWTLAQLTHTNIVPIYSVHRAGPFQAVCMPYLGHTTLADVLNELRGHESLPVSGQGLVSTLFGRKNSTRVQAADAAVPCPGSAAGACTLGNISSGTPGNGAGQTAPESGHTGCTVILDMLKDLTYVEAVLWVASRLADGLAHAHERGILHRDLKPANVLFTDEGQPMLLDFNLAEDTKLRSGASAAILGGTLPYMSPEQLRAVMGEHSVLDGRSDIYSLGVILHELLTGRHPFELNLHQPVRVPELLEMRLRSIPPVRAGNRAVPPALDAIVRRCLQPDPARRYQSARHLQEDFQRQQAHLPLKHTAEPSLRERARKWARRHPRLASATSVATVAAALLLALGCVFIYRGQRLQRLEALATRSEFQDDLRTFQLLLNAQSADQVQLDEAVALGRRALARYRVLDDPAWGESAAVAALPDSERVALREDVGVLALLLGRATSLQATTRKDPSARERDLDAAWQMNHFAESCFDSDPSPRALWTQRADLLRLRGNETEVLAWLDRASRTPLTAARDYYLTAREFVAEGRYREALPLLEKATHQEPDNVWAWFLLGNCHDGLAQDARAVACYGTCIALWPRSARLYFNRGLAHLRQRDYSQASADLDRAIELEPGHADAYFHRGLARQGLTRYADAIDDLSQALDLGISYTRVYFVRARVRERAGDREGAKQDRDAGMREKPTDDKSWLARGIARLAADPHGALADFEQALELNPRSRPALDNKAHVLSERLGQTAEAVKVLDISVSFYPDYVPARASRGVLLARLGRREAALKDAEQSLQRNGDAPTVYQVAGIYALTSRQNANDAHEAFRLLSQALRQGYGLELVKTDTDLDPIRSRPEFRRLVDAARALQPALQEKRPN